MGLSGDQKDRLVEALRAAFPDPGDMGRVVGLADIGVAFADLQVGIGTTYPQALEKLITWADSQERVEDLLWAAREKNSGNPKLQESFRELLPEKGDVVDLEPILKDLSPRWDAEGWSLYDQIALQGWRWRIKDPASLGRLARDLARMPDRRPPEGRYVPLLVFVQELSKHIRADQQDQHQADRLDRWLAGAEKERGGIPGAGMSHRALAPDQSDPSRRDMLPPISKRDLRREMARAYSLSELARLVSDLKEDLMAAQIDPTGWLDPGSGTAEDQAHRLIEALDTRRVLSFLLTALRRDRPDFN